MDLLKRPAAGSIPALDRPGLPPGVCFRLLLIGYFEGVNSSHIERPIRCRCALSGLRTERGNAGPHHDFTQTAADRSGNPPECVQLGSENTG
jgi:hypothetical protein